MLRPYLLNVLLLCVAIILSVAIGAVFIPPATVARIILDAISFQTDPGFWSDTMATIVVQLRLPHTILIALAGAALAASGAAYQGLFQNPLADPYLIGVASGAGLGAVLAMSANWPDNLFGFFSIPIAAFVGASLTVIIPLLELIINLPEPVPPVTSNVTVPGGSWFGLIIFSPT